MISVQNYDFNFDYNNIIICSTTYFCCMVVERGVIPYSTLSNLKNGGAPASRRWVVFSDNYERCAWGRASPAPCGNGQADASLMES